MTTKKMKKKRSSNTDIRIQDVQEILFDAAKNVMRQAYAPYSKFRVGAALIDETGTIHVGTNVENASYGGTICAERAAICSMIAGGGRKLRAIAIVTEKGTPPCGLCRQILSEFAGPEVPVIIAGKKGVLDLYSVGELLPESFGPKNLLKHS
ncbi:MAG TPA: cytidine deaminase [Oligoflexia bacterium]|nr:cytidine deaminase [Oligoflexia bacterium]